MTSVTGGFWAASADVSRTRNVWSASRRREAADNTLRKGNSGPAQGRNGIGPEGAGLVVEVVQGNPGNSAAFGRRPKRQGHRFARAGRAGDDGQPASPRALGDQLGDPRTRHRPVRYTWHGDPGCPVGIPAATAGRLAGAATCPATSATHRIFLLPRRRPDGRSPRETTRRDTATPGRRPGCLALIHQPTQVSQARHHAIGIKHLISMNFRTLRLLRLTRPRKVHTGRPGRGRCTLTTASPHDNPAPTRR